MQAIFDILETNGGRVEFDESLTVKLSPHTPPEKIKAVWLFGEAVYYRNKQEETKVLQFDQTTIVNSVYQRLKILQYQKLIL